MVNPFHPPGNEIRLKDAPKAYSLDVDKLLPPEDTVGRFRERLKDSGLKILQETVRIDNGRLDIPVFFSICSPQAESLIGTRKHMGKGHTPEQAEASAVMELAERFSLFSFRSDPKNFALETYQNIRSHAIPFEHIARSVHDESPDLDTIEEIFSTLPLQWTWGYNLTRSREVLIPFDWFFSINQFNGPSAGNCAEEAILQGTCEVVERHVSSIISRHRIRPPLIDLTSVTDRTALELIRKYRRAGVQLYANDFSLDTGISTVGVVAYDPSTFPHTSEMVWTAGTAPGPEKALCRALTEIAQLGGDFNTSSRYLPSGLPKLEDPADADFLINPGSRRGITELPNLSSDNLRVEAENCFAALSKVGLEVLTLDLTHPRLGVPAFYMIVPGAHFRERAAGSSVAMFSAKLLAESGDPHWAEKKLAEMDRKLPGRYYIKFFLALTRLSSGDPAKALELLEAALALHPNEQDIPSIYSYMAVCLKEQGRYGAAIDLLERAEAHDSKRTDIHNLKGFCFFKLKEHQKAIACFQRVLEIDPGSAIDYANIASNYRDLGDRHSAIRYYRLALDLDPGIDFARENLRMLEQGEKS